MKIAFLGLGNMGTPMARNLLRAGHDVTVWNRTLSKANEFRADNATVAASIAGACREAEIAITMLADDHAVSSAVLDREGVVEHLPPGSIHVSMGTISVALSQQLAGEHLKRGHHYVAAPVFGRPEAAAGAKLFIAAAGDAAALERCRPVFDAIGQRTFIIGPKPEMANVVKLSGNFLISSVVESLGEAVALARKYGIDPHEFVDFLTNTLFAAPVYKTYGSIIADQRYQPAGFKMRLGLKDVRLVLAAAEAVDAPMPIASLVRDNVLAAIGRGMEDYDWSATAKLAAENAGLK
ncbi:MAG TPA: NAD(P)-dependent oxidoreductase [Candidatus Eisenbacteria bacterium]|nr:NAD(P)-dependent oxidoreductase [Candidatus Eisenbacteria bacterium]